MFLYAGFFFYPGVLYLGWTVVLLLLLMMLLN